MVKGYFAPLLRDEMIDEMDSVEAEIIELQVCLPGPQLSPEERVELQEELSRLQRSLTELTLLLAASRGPEYQRTVAARTRVSPLPCSSGHHKSDSRPCRSPGRCRPRRRTRGCPETAQRRSADGVRASRQPGRLSRTTS
jgi:hypothetical protein